MRHSVYCIAEDTKLPLVSWKKEKILDWLKSKELPPHFPAKDELHLYTCKELVETYCKFFVQLPATISILLLLQANMWFTELRKPLWGKHYIVLPSSIYNNCFSVKFWYNCRSIIQIAIQTACKRSYCSSVICTFFSCSEVQWSIVLLVLYNS